MPAHDPERWQQIENGDWIRTTADRNEPEIKATEGAKAVADEYGVDLNTITGTGKDGKITKADVEAALN